MQIDSVFKHICSDKSSLVEYTYEIPPDINVIKRRLFLMARAENRRIPDQYYRITFDKEMQDINALPDLICKGFSNLSSTYLEFRGSQIYVKSDMQNRWQELITYISPLILQMSFLQSRHSVKYDDFASVRQYYFQYINPYFKYTALPYPYYVELESVVSQSHGLHDLHIHLNGSIEADNTWNYCLKYASSVGGSFDAAYKDRRKEMVREQWEQELGFSHISSLEELLMRAKTIRFILWNFLYPINPIGKIRDLIVKVKDDKSYNTFTNYLQFVFSTYKNDKLSAEALADEVRYLLPNIISSNKKLQDSVNKLSHDLESYQYPYSDDWSPIKYLLQESRQNPIASHDSRHPFADLIYDGKSYNELGIEGLMYVLVIRYLQSNPRESVAALFHYYLLIQGLINRLLVQQVHQKGFSQFQKITLNDIRYDLEKDFYLSRFHQLNGNFSRNIRHIEGRFSPKFTEGDNLKLLNIIEHDWSLFKKEWAIQSLHLDNLPYDDQLILKKENDPNAPELSLVAHFIKVADKKLDKKSNDEIYRVRHHQLRTELWRKGVALSLLRKNSYKYSKRIVGIDAASSELDAPPEVFAPLYRYLRRHGFTNFTYHAGEDFNHILSGMRAIYEAIEFCELKDGNRIGHACAAGLDPQLWINDIGNDIYIKQGEYLDDLIFVYHLILSSENIDDNLISLLSLLESNIQKLAIQIYQRSYSTDMLILGWRLRKYCPILFLCDNREEAEHESVFDEDEWTDIESRRNELPIEGKNVKNIIQLYHDKDVRERYDKIIEVRTNKYLKVADYEALQLLLLEYMTKKGIVIESLPTSNVRIGHYINYDTYHLWRWYQWHKEGHAIPAVVLGTDDPGIFATNIYNEYANVMCNLIQTQKLSRTEALSIIKQLDENGHIYKFKDPTPPDCQY